MIIWSGDEGNDPEKDDEIPDDLVLHDLTEVPKQLDLLTPVKFKFAEHAVENVIASTTLVFDDLGCDRNGGLDAGCQRAILE